MARTRDVLPGTNITATELRTVKLAADGATHAEIAAVFGINRTAVDSRFYRLSKRLGTRSATHTVVEFLRRGWLRLDDLGEELQ